MPFEAADYIFPVAAGVQYEPLNMYTRIKSWCWHALYTLKNVAHFNDHDDELSASLKETETILLKLEENSRQNLKKDCVKQASGSFS